MYSVFWEHEHRALANSVKEEGLILSANGDNGSKHQDGPEVGLTGRPVRKFPEPKPLDRHGPAKIISMCNQKGGVGKTTSTINLGACLADLGRRVLLVDLDPQGALSAGLGVPHEELDLTV